MRPRHFVIAVLSLAFAAGRGSPQQAPTPGTEQATPPGDVAPAPGNPPVLSVPVAATGGAGFAIAGPEIPASLRSPSPATPCYLLLDADRAILDDPALIDPVIESARVRGLRVVVRISDAEWQPISAWFTRLQGFAAAVGRRVDAWQILGPQGAALAPREYAYVLKNARVALRAGGAQGPIVSLPLPADASWTAALFAEDAGPYIDIVAAPDTGSFAAIAEMRDRLHARAPIWITDAPIDAAHPAAAAVRDYLETTSEGSAVILFVAPPEQAAVADAAAAALVSTRALFPPALRPAAAGSLPFEPAGATEGGAAGKPVPVAIDALPFFDAETRDGIAAYRLRPAPAADASTPAGEPPPAPVAIRLTLRSYIEALDLVVPSTGRTHRLAEAAPPGAVIELPLRDEYMVLRYRVAAATLPVKEATGVAAISELTAEEIIAREREVRGVQDARLHHYEAKATISIHYRLASLGETIDLVTENRLFVGDGRQDYQQTAMYVNGSLWRGKEPPYLPYLQPETVAEVPLNILLDERYRYALEGRENVDGRECYVLSFEPATETTESLYKGRVYIDTRVFTRVRMTAVQTHVGEPLRSNEVVYRYGPVETSGGEVWLPQSITGQLTFELLGYSLAVEREATYTEYATNEDGFETRRAAAYDSGKPLFRETKTGFYRLENDGDQESLRRLDAPRNTLLVMGVSVGEGGIPGFPFAGVNFFDFNFHGTGTQFNLAWAGPFVDISWNQPNLFDTPVGRRPWSLALQGSLNALETEDKNATLSGTPSDDRVDILRELVRASMSIPVGDFLRFSVETRWMYQNYDRTPDTSVDFVLPSTDVEAVAAGRLEYSRLGYLFDVWGEWGRRSAWEPWGLPGQRWSPDDIDFTRLGADARKSIYFGIYNKLSFGVSGFEGHSLDRFSRFELGDFRAARVRGFNGSGIHFDRGLMVDAAWSFPISHSVRADIGVQDGFVHSGDDFGDGYERIVGSGLSLEFSGPWSTFVTVRMSTALSSTIPDKGGGGDVRIVFFKTFNKWSRKGGDHRPPAVPIMPTAIEGDAPSSPPPP